MKIVFHKALKNDLRIAYQWYEEQRKGLGEDFLSTFEASVHALQRNPLSYTQVYKELRRIVFKRFPYSLYYQVDSEEDKIIVFAVIHVKRNPSIWQKRQLD